MEFNSGFKGLKICTACYYTEYCRQL